MGTFGGAKRDRTADLLHAMQALSQLSYSPVSGRRAFYAEHTPSSNGKLLFFCLFLILRDIFSGKLQAVQDFRFIQQR